MFEISVYMTKIKVSSELSLVLLQPNIFLVPANIFLQNALPIYKICILYYMYNIIFLISS